MHKLVVAIGLIVALDHLFLDGQLVVKQLRQLARYPTQESEVGR